MDGPAAAIADVDGRAAPPPAVDARAAPLAAVPGQAAPVPGGGRGALYRICRAGNTAYLFGTVHVGKPDFYPLPSAVAQALDQASTLVLELDIRDNAAFQHALASHGTYPPGQHLRAHLSAATLARLDAVLAARGATVESVDRLKPWLVANLLAGAVVEQQGFHRSDGLESYLLAQARGRTVAELESADLQLAVFDSMGDAQAEAWLNETLDDLADGGAVRKARELLDAWYSGDSAAQQAALDHATAGDAAVEAFTRRVLLGQRNPGMAAGIDRIVQRGGTSFVGVGLLHLLGAHGLPQLLAERGYTVVRLQ
jgi:uncharacterized protein YbaP (TraB family)